MQIQLSRARFYPHLAARGVRRGLDHQLYVDWERLRLKDDFCAMEHHDVMILTQLLDMSTQT